MTEPVKTTVYTVTQGIVKKLGHQLETSSGRATLASIRNTVGKSLYEATVIWSILFENLPEEFLSPYQHPSDEELAIYAALQLYALHQQEIGMNITTIEDSRQNIGESLKYLRIGDGTTAIDNRFNRMITSSTFEELLTHLRHLIKLLKSKANNAINYGQLAEDFYWFLRGSQDSVRLRWARSYYKLQNKGELDNDN